jgi:ABC-type oligopeptide transport system substrate-binding subunit
MLQNNPTLRVLLTILILSTFALTACSGELALSSSSDSSSGETNGGLSAEIGIGDSDNSDNTNPENQSNRGSRTISNQTLLFILAVGAILVLILMISRRSI